MVKNELKPMSYQEMKALYTKAMDDFNDIANAGPSAFATEEEFAQALSDQFGVLYALEESMANS